MEPLLPDSPLMRLRRAASGDYSKLGPAKPLEDVTLQQGWAETNGGIDDRMRSISQVELVQERNRPLKRRVLTAAALFLVLYTVVIRSALHAQQQRWQHRPNDVIALTGPDGSLLVPLAFSFWYFVICFAATRSMANLKPMESLVFETMVAYNILQAAICAYVALAVFHEVGNLGLHLAGNSAPVRGPEHHRLATLAILHYHLRILELCDTFFLILRKKVQTKSLPMHVILRVQNVWGWHVACRFGCGGDIYFPLAVNALGSVVLHLHYVVALLGPQGCKRLGGGQSRLRRELVTTVQHWIFRICLLHGLLSFAIGAYPRFVILFQLAQMLFGIVLFSNFHYEETSGSSSSLERLEGSACPGKLSFSFDSSGWCYFYHFGVALWIQENFKTEIARGDLQFSGSSGGALVACSLAAGLDIPAVVDSVLHRTWLRARHQPWHIPDEVGIALEQHLKKNVHQQISNRLQVLATRAVPRPPFLMGEVISDFKSKAHVIDALQASSHMPLIFGFGHCMNGARYFDGLLWPNCFVPWRSFAPSQRVCRVSAFSAPGSDIGPRWHAMPPFWWPVFPPSQEALEGLMWAGYRDIAAIFGTGGIRPGVACGPCAKRLAASEQRSSLRSSDVTTERIDDLIRIYERTAQWHWACLLGLSLAATLVFLLVWLRFLTGN